MCHWLHLAFRTQSQLHLHRLTLQQSTAFSHFFSHFDSSFLIAASFWTGSHCLCILFFNTRLDLRRGLFLVDSSSNAPAHRRLHNLYIHPCIITNLDEREQKPRQLASHFGLDCFSFFSHEYTKSTTTGVGFHNISFGFLDRDFFIKIWSLANLAALSFSILHWPPLPRPVLSTSHALMASDAGETILGSNKKDFSYFSYVWTERNDTFFGGNSG